MKLVRMVLCVMVIVAVSFLFIGSERIWSAYFFPLMIGLIVLVFVFNAAVRKSLRFKSYFTGRLNFLTSKYRGEIKSEIPANLLLEKLKEVLPAAGFKVVDVNERNRELLAVSGFSLRSWGENIYITLVPEGKHTMVRFVSATVLQVCSWGKNEENIRLLFEKLDDSLII